MKRPRELMHYVCWLRSMCLPIVFTSVLASAGARAPWPGDVCGTWLLKEQGLATDATAVALKEA